MLRETTFWTGGIVMIALGGLLAVGLFWSGAGLEYFDAWLGSGIAIGFGAFFLYVARAEHRDRLRFFGDPEHTYSEPPRKPSQ